MRENPAGAARSLRVISVSSEADWPHLFWGSGHKVPGISFSSTFHHSVMLVTIRCMDTLLFGMTAGIRQFRVTCILLACCYVHMDQKWTYVNINLHSRVLADFLDKRKKRENRLFTNLHKNLHQDYRLCIHVHCNMN